MELYLGTVSDQVVLPMKLAVPHVLFVFIGSAILERYENVVSMGHCTLTLLYLVRHLERVDRAPWLHLADILIDVASYLLLISWPVFAGGDSRMIARGVGLNMHVSHLWLLLDPHVPICVPTAGYALFCLTHTATMSY